MKTVCKKLLCLMLVAMMLVSAVPFAFAATGDDNVLWVELWVDGAHTASGLQIPCKVGDEVSADAVRAAAEAHWSTEFATYEFVSAEGATITDGVIGVKVHLKTKAAPVCEHTEVTTTNTATCGADGVKTTTCKACGEVLNTENVAATGNHNFSGGACTVCGESRDYIDTITFYYLDSEGNETSAVRYVYEDGATITPPAVPANPKAGFSYWAENANGGGDTINADESLVYNSQTPNEFHAIYNKKSAMSELKIYVVRYVNGVRKEAHYLFSEHFTTSNDNNMYQYLWANKDAIRTAAIDELGEGYTWNNKFYNYFTDEELTDANLKDNGDKSVYIKMNTKNSNEAQVLIYVHKKVSSTVYDILEMDGYNAGEWVYLKDVKNFLDDEGYNWSSTSSLYTDEQWDDLLDGESPSGANGIKITDNGTYKIHIVLNGVSNSKADSSNPKTGDNIMIAVTTMTLAAAALVSMVELKKRKMI